MKEAINIAFDMDFQISQINDTKGLPFYMLSKRQFYRMNGTQISFVMVKLQNDERFGVIALDKQRTKYEETFCSPVAFWFDALAKNQRDALVRKHIPFVTENEQFYLPFLGIVYYNNYKSKQNVNMEKMMPATQKLFLYLIYLCKGKKILKKQAADDLCITRTSITRASAQLAAMGLICQETQGRETYMWVEEPGDELFQKACTHLVNPIQEILTVEYSDELKSLPLAGESALAECTMLNVPSIKHLAIDKSLVKNMQLNIVDERWEEQKHVVKLELWKYDPCIFAQAGVVDPISLFASFMNNEDERIEGALEELMEEYTWS